MLVLLLCSFSCFEAKANHSRRAVLQGLLSLGITPVLESVPFGGAIDPAGEVNPFILDIAEIRNLQWHRLRQPRNYTNRFYGHYINDIENLDLVTQKARTIRDRLLTNINRMLDEIQIAAQQVPIPEAHNQMFTEEGREVFDKLTNSLIYNIVLIRSLLSPTLLQKVSSQLGFSASFVQVTDSEMETLIDYSHLLLVNFDRFESDAEGYSLLVEYFRDSQTWFPSLNNQNEVTPALDLSCKSILL